MSIRNLDALFAPRSIALAGATDKPGRVGTTVLRNLLAGGYAGRIYPVNSRRSRVAGVRAWPNAAALPQTPDLVVVCTPPERVPAVIADFAARGTRAAVIITAGLGATAPGADRTLREQALAAARPHLMRILGPNCVGLLVPGLGINASFAHVGARPGRLAFVSQSGALVTSVLDYANSRGIGFSKFVSLGDGSDIDFGDLLDWLARDAGTDAILLYAESVTAARKFMSAGRLASRVKPVVIVKAGRVPEGARAAASHTGAMTGADDVYDAAIRRAGMLRVHSTGQLFAAVETLARRRPLPGERLAILTNGGGPGVMATDALVLNGGRMAELAPDTVRRLDAVLPATWSRGNPVDIIGDAGAARYVDALRIVLEDGQTDAVLVLHAPSAIVSSAEIASALAAVAGPSRRNVLACWLGGEGVRRAAAPLTAAGVPCFDTPEQAVEAFLQMVEHQRNQALLGRVPPALPPGPAPDLAAIRAIVERCIAEGRELLTEPEAKDVLAAHGIPVARTRVAADARAAVRIAREIGYPVAVKILSPDVSHKTEVGGVALDLADAAAVRAACRAMEARLAAARPGARLAGFAVQEMVRGPGAVETIVGATLDPTFGPVVLFGQGGTTTEVSGDRAIALPPVDAAIARDLVSRTRVSRLLAGARGQPPADLDALAAALVSVSAMLAHIPEIAELDVNPLLCSAGGVIALDARIRVSRSAAGGVERFAIRPYPDALETRVVWGGETLLVRPIRPEDAPQHLAFFRALTPEDVRLRAFASMRELPEAALARLTQIDYEREMAFIATRTGADGQPETIGVARAVTDPDNTQADFALIVRSDVKGRGLGAALLELLIAYCRSRGTAAMTGETLRQNARMIALARHLGFAVRPGPDDETVLLDLDLRPEAPARPGAPPG